ncbi:MULTISPECIES: DUF4232 domain-containing protein [Streptomyces]|uniref:DUF4232 domain-containing protein n=1 Tax=Streptomyces thermogriseus TaxID=75292 RepID=A0ABP4DHT1_9ACTN|nr:DUF4232 domain-containing protein [Streptomyces thermovulgaris]
MRARPIIVTTLTAALLLTACGSDGSDSGNSGNSGNKNSGSSGHSEGKDTGSSACTIGDVEIQVGPANTAPAAGDTGNVPVTLTNRGAACTLEGFPAVSLSADGTTATVPEDRTAEPQRLTLAEDGTASFTLTYVRGKEEDARSLAATSLRIGLPGADDSRDFEWSYGPVQGRRDASDPDASVTAFQQAGD